MVLYKENKETVVAVLLILYYNYINVNETVEVSVKDAV